jgi:hypothetical protein
MVLSTILANLHERLSPSLICIAVHPLTPTPTSLRADQPQTSSYPSLVWTHLGSLIVHPLTSCPSLLPNKINGDVLPLTSSCASSPSVVVVMVVVNSSAVGAVEPVITFKRSTRGSPSTSSPTPSTELDLSRPTESRMDDEARCEEGWISGIRPRERRLPSMMMFLSDTRAHRLQSPLSGGFKGSTSTRSADKSSPQTSSNEQTRPKWPDHISPQTRDTLTEPPSPISHPSTSTSPSSPPPRDTLPLRSPDLSP